MCKGTFNDKWLATLSMDVARGACFHVRQCHLSVPLDQGLIYSFRHCPNPPTLRDCR